MVSWGQVLSVDTLERKPSVIFLPGHFFFAKSLDLPQGMGGNELDAYIDISLEEHAPFPVTQLYSGAYHPEGAGRILIYAAYRKRFTAGEKELWDDADLVLPDFAALLGAAPKEAAVYVLVQEGTVTGLYFDGKDPVPADLFSRHLDPEVPAAERDRTVSALVERFVSTRGRVPVRYFRRKGEVSKHKGKVYFSLVETREDGEPGPSAAKVNPAVDLAAVSRLDVREADFLAAKKKAAVWNVWFWRSTVSLAAILFLLLVGEGILYAAENVLRNRAELVEQRAEQVAMVQEQLELAERMEELGESRLLPFEMLAILNDYRPRSLTFQRTVTNEWNGLMVEAVTGDSRDVNQYETALKESGKFDRVEVFGQQVRPDGTTFRLEVVFKSEVLRDRVEMTGGSPDGAARDLEMAGRDGPGEETQ